MSPMPRHLRCFPRFMKIKATAAAKVAPAMAHPTPIPIITCDGRPEPRSLESAAFDPEICGSAVSEKFWLDFPWMSSFTAEEVQVFGYLLLLSEVNYL